MTILPSSRDPPTCAASTRPARAAGRRDPRDDHRDRRQDRRPSRLVARRRRADDRAPPAARVAARPDRLGHRPPGLPAQAADRPPGAVRDAPPARRRRRLPAAQRIAARRVRRRPRRHRPVDRRGPGRGARPAPRARADRGRRRRRGADERPVARGAQRHRPPPDPDADRAQRQRDVDQPDGRRVLASTSRQIKLSRAWQQSKTRLRPRPSSGCRSSAATALELSRGSASRSSTSPSPASCSRTSGSPTSASCPATTCTRCSSDARPGARRCTGPTIVHVRTQKGRGYRPAEADQVGFHGAALPPMTGAGTARRRRQRRSPRAADGPTRTSMADDATPADRAPRRRRSRPNYTAVLRGRADRAGPDGSAHRRRSPPACRPGPGWRGSRPRSRTASSTSGIAEQHAVTLATGLAMGGMRPVVAIYSTFLQRAFDQTVHDVCQNDQPVVIAVDRAGPRRRGRHQPPGHVHAARPAPAARTWSSPRPKDEQELRSLLRTAFAQDHPFALHYPRDAGLRPARRSSRRSSRSAAARSCARAATC